MIRVLIIGAGSPHNNYTGVDGLANSRIPLSYNLIKYAKSLGEEVYISFCNLNYPTDNPSIVNPILQGLGIEGLRHLFTRQMMALPVSPQEAHEFGYDVVIAELRPNSFSLRHPFSEQYVRLHKILSKKLEQGSRVILWDMDEWYKGWMDLVRKGALIARIYEKEPDGAESKLAHMWSWDMNEFKREFEILNHAIPEHQRYYDFWYCGNTYGRQDRLMMVDRAVRQKPKIRFAVTGNWVRKENIADKSIDGFTQLKMIGQSDHVFTIPLMHLSKAAVIIGNKKHREYGLLACRVFEAGIAHTPLLIDGAYKDHTDMYKHAHPDLFFDNLDELIQKLEAYSNNYTHNRDRLVRHTHSFIRGLGSPDETYKWFLGL